jgi:hypothetical protein
MTRPRIESLGGGAGFPACPYAAINGAHNKTTISKNNMRNRK